MRANSARKDGISASSSYVLWPYNATYKDSCLTMARVWTDINELLGYQIITHHLSVYSLRQHINLWQALCMTTIIGCQDCSSGGKKSGWVPAWVEDASMMWEILHVILLLWIWFQWLPVIMSLEDFLLIIAQEETYFVQQMQFSCFNNIQIS